MQVAGVAGQRTFALDGHRNIRIWYSVSAGYDSGNTLRRTTGMRPGAGGWIVTRKHLIGWAALGVMTAAGPLAAQDTSRRPGANPIIRNPASFTIHPGIAELTGQGDIFLHNATLTVGDQSGAVGRRTVTVEHLQHNPDGALKPVIQTEAGVPVPPPPAK